ncbi:MAG: AAA family ATPase [Methylophaga sp.]|nr:AAA family ATPase [Methylophaga sp.]
MLNSEDLSEVEMRAIIKEKFDGHIRTGNIAFTTFHQSYGYEDFVEGIKAETIDNQVNYSVEPGIFKQLCEKASANIERVADESDFQLGNKRVWKMSLGNSQTDEGDSVFQECRSNSYVLLGYGDDIDFSGCDSHQKVKDKYISSGYEPKNQDYSVSSVHTFINKIKVGDIIVVSDGNHRYRAIAEVTGEYRKLVDDRDHWFQMRSVKWHVVFNPSQQRENICKKAFSQMTLYELKTNTLDRTALQELLVPKNMSEDGDKQPYVLIIDEINRGNISKIFGELITLIEPDKREGEAEALTVILPYSKEPFSVPKNVHIIGTMNTADASIAKLDVALRRRFKFTEMPPEPSLLRTVNFIIDDNNEIDINLKSMLIAINQRIELLYDRDHTIGHSFFMKLTNGRPIADLASIFEKEIIPLLQEYFFDDWERIHWVLDAYKANDEFWFIRKKKNAIDVMGGRWKSDTNQSALADVWELNLNDNRELTQEPEAYIGIYSESVNKPKSDQAEK